MTKDEVWFVGSSIVSFLPFQKNFKVEEKYTFLYVDCFKSVKGRLLEITLNYSEQPERGFPKIIIFGISAPLSEDSEKKREYKKICGFVQLIKEMYPQIKILLIIKKPIYAVGDEAKTEIKTIKKESSANHVCYLLHDFQKFLSEIDQTMEVSTL